jgi:hypothetical protein
LRYCHLSYQGVIPVHPHVCGDDVGP